VSGRFTDVQLARHLAHTESRTPNKYSTIVADPPWDYPEGFAERVDAPHKQDRDRGVIGTKIAVRPLPYSSLSIQQIAELPIPALAAADCRLFLWATNRYLPFALSICSDWGFSYRQLLVWDKTPTFNPLSGSVAAQATEFAVVAVRGKPARLAKAKSNVVRGQKPRASHSRKPDSFLDLVEEVSPGPYLELFARRQRLGWDTWGNEALEHVELPA
jgi:N6-adenosine-specific RNA methylase IME4